MYSFEGQFRRIPEQNLAGASKKEHRDELLNRAHYERLMREVIIFRLDISAIMFHLIINFNNLCVSKWLYATCYKILMYVFLKTVTVVII